MAFGANVRIFCSRSKNHAKHTGCSISSYPVLGPRPVAALTRGILPGSHRRVPRKGLSRKSIENIGRTVSSALSQAVEDGLLTANPAVRLGSYYRTANDTKPDIQPLTREEAAEFLKAAREHAPREHPLFLCALRIGMRLGELLALRWGNIDFAGRLIEVRRNLHRHSPCNLARPRDLPP